MATTLVFYHDTPGESLTVRLNNVAGAMVNGTEPDALVEVDAETKPLRYEAMIAEDLASQRLIAQVFDNVGLLYTGLVVMAAEGESCIIDDLAQREDVERLREGITVGTEVKSFSPDALAQLAVTSSITVSIPTLSGRTLSTPLIQGNSYLAEHGRAIEFSRSDFPNIPSGSQVRLSARQLDDENVTFGLSGAVAVATGVKVVRFEPTTLQTRDWVPGKYQFDVEVVFPDGNVVTFVGPDLYLRVLADVSPN